MSIYFSGAQQTNHPDATRWNERYQKDSAGWLSHPPKKLLVDFAHLLPQKGLALDVAAGVATNSLFLVERGLSPVALDISFVGLQIAKERFLEKGERLNAIVCDLAELWLPANHFEVIINFCFLERSTFPFFLHSLKPGGLLFFESYLNDTHQVPHSEYYLKSGELREAFSGLEIIHSKQIVRKTRKQNPERKLEQLIVRKRQLPGAQ